MLVVCTVGCLSGHGCKTNAVKCRPKSKKYTAQKKEPDLLVHLEGLNSQSLGLDHLNLG